MYVYYNMTNTTSDEDKIITDKPNIKLETDELEEVKIEDILDNDISSEQEEEPEVTEEPEATKEP